MLILAGIVLTLTIGEHGIIARTQVAGENYINAQKQEEYMLNAFEQKMDEIVNNDSVNSKKTTLVSQIKPSDYGKSINYSVTVNGIELNNWKVFYNDGTNVYIIAGEYLPNAVVDLEKTGMVYGSGSYAIKANVTDKNEAIEILTNPNNWEAFAKGKGAKSAQGAPTLEMWLGSWHAKGYTHVYTDKDDAGYYMGLTENPKSRGQYSFDFPSGTIGTTDELFYPHQEIIDNGKCFAYWIASPSAQNNSIQNNSIMYAIFGGVASIYINPISTDGACVRPVVCLQSNATGTITTENKVIID